jgi:hypothetical protein
VGYLYAAGWWVWRRRRPSLAVGSLAAGTVVGTLLGIGRMAAGGHFLSDVAWSGLIALSVAHVVYYYLLRIPAREDARETPYPRLESSPRRKAAAIAGAILLCAGIVGGGILATPHYADLAAGFRPGDFPAAPERLEVTADALDVEIVLSAGPDPEIRCSGYVHGFGLPSSRFRADWEFDERPIPTLRYRVTRTGVFTDIDGVARLRLPRRLLRSVLVRVGRGDITVIDEQGSAASSDRAPALELHTSDGRIRRSEPAATSAP